MAHWSEVTLPVLDFESTGVNPREDRAVSVALLGVTREGDITPSSYQAIINPGIPIPEGASAVHGITDEIVKAKGVSPEEAFKELYARVLAIYEAKLPLVIYNAPFDWPLLHEELKRIGLKIPSIPIIDPLLLDRTFDKYRKGLRKLQDTARLYGVDLSNAHDATADCVASVQIVRAIFRKFPFYRKYPIKRLHEMQIEWYEDWKTGINAYWERTKQNKRVTETWPGV